MIRYVVSSRCEWIRSGPHPLYSEYVLYYMVNWKVGSLKRAKGDSPTTLYTALSYILTHSLILTEFDARPTVVPISLANQINLQPTTNVNVGNGSQPPASGMNISPNQILINPGDINMTQNSTQVKTSAWH